MNLVLNPNLDTKNYKNLNNPKARDKLLEIIENNDLVDTFRHCNPDKLSYSWLRRNPIQCQIRLFYTK